MGLEGEVGSIEAGKRADFAILGDDPTSVEPAMLKAGVSSWLWMRRKICRRSRSKNCACFRTISKAAKLYCRVSCWASLSSSRLCRGRVWSSSATSLINCRIRGLAGSKPASAGREPTAGADSARCLGFP